MIQMVHSQEVGSRGEQWPRGVSVEAPSPWFPLRGVRLTARGLVGTVIMVLVWYGSVAVESNLLLLLCGMFVGLLLVSSWLSTGAVGRLSIWRVVPETAVAGQACAVRYLVHNPCRHRVRSVWIRELDADGTRLRMRDTYLPMVEGRSTAAVEGQGSALRRGRTRLGRISLVSRFPFGLVRARREVSTPDVFTVWPELHPVRGNVLGGQDRGTGRSAAVRHLHRGVDDFLGLREYRTGDSLRWIHWRRSARTGQLVIRQMFPYTSTACIIMVDHRLAGAGRAAEMRREQVVSAAASLACQALEQGFRVGLIGLAREPAAIPPVSGRACRGKIVAALADMEGEPAGGLEDTLEGLRRCFGQEARCVLFTSSRDRQIDRLEASLSGPGVEVNTFRPGTKTFAAIFGPPGPAGVAAEAACRPGFHVPRPTPEGHRQPPPGTPTASGAGGPR